MLRASRFTTVSGLNDVVARLEPGRRHRCLAFVDDGLLQAIPVLAQQITAYARMHAARMELVSEPIPVPGGERIKNELYFVEQMQARHRKEAKELQGRITSKKKNASKKTRKGVNDECAAMEAQLREKHAAELGALNGDAVD
jgi:hypothetical protein